LEGPPVFLRSPPLPVHNETRSRFPSFFIFILSFFFFFSRMSRSFIFPWFLRNFFFFWSAWCGQRRVGCSSFSFFCFPRCHFFFVFLTHPRGALTYCASSHGILGFFLAGVVVLFFSSSRGTFGPSCGCLAPLASSQFPFILVALL